MATTTAGTFATSALRQEPGRLTRLMRVARNKPVGVVGFFLIVVFVTCAVFAPFIAPYDPVAQNSAATFQPPGPLYWFGTDNFGRDIFSRIIWGAQVSLIVGVAAVSVGTVLGTTLGIVSGYFEGRTDMIIQRIMDAWMAFPGIIFALALLAALAGSGVPVIFAVIIAIGLGGIPTTNRIVRSTVLKEKNNVYVEAAFAIGCTKRRIMARHIFPNVLAPVIVIATISLAEAILAEAALSFLGVGIQPPQPSWGQMLSGNARTYMLAAPWMAIFPGIAISLAVLGWNLLGDALRDIFDPRLRGTGGA
jgi:peptide/nickel transport system permease protein